MENSTKFEINLNEDERASKTAFHLACENGHLRTVEILLQKSAIFGIDPNAKSNNGRTGFQYACFEGGLGY